MVARMGRRKSSTVGYYVNRREKKKGGGGHGEPPRGARAWKLKRLSRGHFFYSRHELRLSIPDDVRMSALHLHASPKPFSNGFCRSDSLRQWIGQLSGNRPKMLLDHCLPDSLPRMLTTQHFLTNAKRFTVLGGSSAIECHHIISSDKVIGCFNFFFFLDKFQPVFLQLQVNCACCLNSSCSLAGDSPMLEELLHAGDVCCKPQTERTHELGTRLQALRSCLDPVRGLA